MRLETYFGVLKQIKHAMDFIGLHQLPSYGEKIPMKIMLKYIAELSTIESSVQNTYQETLQY